MEREREDRTENVERKKRWRVDDRRERTNAAGGFNGEREGRFRGDFLPIFPHAGFSVFCFFIYKKKDNCHVGRCGRRRVMGVEGSISLILEGKEEKRHHSCIVAEDEIIKTQSIREQSEHQRSDVHPPSASLPCSQPWHQVTSTYFILYLFEYPLTRYDFFLSFNN
jgi:hypothetical protein